MESSAFAFKRNLEIVGHPRIVGPWRHACALDPISERRYLVLETAADKLSSIDPAVFLFRSQSARALCANCAEVHETDVSGARLTVLTPFVRTIDELEFDEAQFDECLGVALRALATFDATGFPAFRIGTHAVGIDEDGVAALLPSAWILPPREDETDGDPATRARELVGEFVERARQADPAWARRVAQARERAGHEVATLYAAIFSRPLLLDPVATGRTQLMRREASSEMLAVNTSRPMIRVTGGDGSGKTAALESIAASIRARGKRVRFIDEWDLAPVAKRRSGPRDGDSVWFVDDVDSRPHLHAAIIDHVAAGDVASGPRLVIADNPAMGTAESMAFLQTLQMRAGAEPETIELAEGLGDRPVLDAAKNLSNVERQIVELCAVAALPLPIDVLIAAFPDTDGDFHRRVHRLCGLGYLHIDYRCVPPASTLTVSIRMSRASLRRELESGIPEARRSSLHRTVARMCSDRGGVAPEVVYGHLVACGDRKAAGRYGIRFLRESTRDQRTALLDRLVHDFVAGGLEQTLSYGDRIFALTRLAGDLFARGRRAEAEELVLRARGIPADAKDLQKNAARVGELVRLLADVWAARSNYKEALDLLSKTRRDLSPYLSLADQAQLLNEIGWLQYRLGDYDRSVESCKVSLNTLNPNEHPLVVAQALNLMGVIHFNTSRYDEAISYYEQSAFLREKEGDHNGLAGSNNNLALAYQARGEYDKALSAYARSLEIKKQQNNEAGIAAGYLNLALLYMEVHNFTEAENKCRESLQISVNLGIAQLTAENHSTLGDIALSRGQYDDAETCYRKSLALAQSLETVNEEMGANRRLARLYLTKNRLPDARASIDRAAQLGRQIGSRYESAQIESVFGDLCLAEGQTAEAVDHFEKAASAYATVSKYMLAATALARIGHAHVRSGNMFEARRYLDRASDITKTEIGHQIPDEIAELQQMLREQPPQAGAAPAGEPSQELLFAFYELSSLSEYADDRRALHRRAISIFQSVARATRCIFALRTDEDAFVQVLPNGEQEPLIDIAQQALFTRALQLGTLLHNESTASADITEHIKLPADTGFICIPMKSMGTSLGCAFLHVARTAVPPSSEDVTFLTSLGRHVAGNLRLTRHFEQQSFKEETMEMEVETLKAQVVDRYHFKNLIGKDEAMRKVFRILDKVKEMDTGILIIGESGTGKTEMARAIHYNSRRRRYHFQQIHCAEIPSSLLESELFGHERGAFTGAVGRKLGRCEVADGGTVFLDDVNVMPTDTQAKLLHYLENKSFMRLGGTQKITTDVRIIAASNEDLEQLAKQGRFREDLYYRLKVIQVDLPPLRDRHDDMIAIAQEFLKRRCEAQNKPLKTLSTEAIKLFQKYHWPGNVRELQNILEQVVLLSDDDIVDPSSLPEDFLRKTAAGGRPRWQTLEALAQQMVETDSYSSGNPLMPQLEAMLADKMVEHAESKARAATLLGITRPTLYNRLRGFDKMQ